MSLERISSELSFLTQDGYTNPAFDSIDFWQCEYKHGRDLIPPSEDSEFLYDLVEKILHRGERTFPTRYVEALFVRNFGNIFNLRKMPNQGKGSIVYAPNPGLENAYRLFTDFVEPWNGDIKEVLFDQENPENERRLFENLLKRFGPKIAHYLYTQVSVDTLLTGREAQDFAGQHLDFLLAFPNQQTLILEPGNYKPDGDHAKPLQKERDKQRDKAFSDIGIKTLRPDNSRIDDAGLYLEIEHELEGIDAKKFLANSTESTKTQLVENYYFLLPSLIARMERVLSFYLIGRGLVSSPRLTIEVVERDLAVTEWAFLSFFERLHRLADLYAIKLPDNNIELRVVRNKEYVYGSRHLLPGLLARFGVAVQEIDINQLQEADLFLDVAIKSNWHTSAFPSNVENRAVIRNSYKHNSPVRFAYLSSPRAVVSGSRSGYILRTFLRDFFRKSSFRSGQLRIIEGILRQRNTIGLLSTSGGKSICYQICALLSPGSTIVVDPIIALMKNQVKSLCKRFRINRVKAWHADANIHDNEAANILNSNVIIFLSPERFLRRTFRAAMHGLPGADVYINYVIVDEAHYASMWGHDFRPSYLSLERNIPAYCTFHGHTSVIVALTGTASQLVLIDLQRVLGIKDLDAIIRPESSERRELSFSIISCTSGKKYEKLQSDALPGISRGLRVPDLLTGAWGMIFAYTRPKIWELFGQLVGNAPNYIRTALITNDPVRLLYGLYCGGMPQGVPLNSVEWNAYKDKTLEVFESGVMRRLIGNTAISVGIDNEYLNYIVNYSMPQSLEAYYQQCGRAGRNGQPSECYLIFSDDHPSWTKEWFVDPKYKMPQRWDDVGTVVYFYGSNFPGVEVELPEALQVLEKIFNRENEDGGWPIFNSLPFEREIDPDNNPTEKYITYWLMLGVVDDYEVQGVGARTLYRVKRSDVVEEFLSTQNLESLQRSIITHLHNYLMRYRPVRLADIEDGVEKQEGVRFSTKAIRYLLAFIYREIAYQRKAAIRTMWNYCNEKNTSSDHLRAIITAYFDRSEFSDLLDAMAGIAPSFTLVDQVIEKIDGFDDIERLFWETRRLLDERYRPDWAAINLMAVLCRTKVASDESVGEFVKIVNELRSDPQDGKDNARYFIKEFLFKISLLCDAYDGNIAPDILRRFVEALYSQFHHDYILIIDELLVSDDLKKFLKVCVSLKQMEGLLNAVKHKHGLG